MFLWAEEHTGVPGLPGLDFIDIFMVCIHMFLWAKEHWGVPGQASISLIFSATLLSRVKTWLEAQENPLINFHSIQIYQSKVQGRNKKTDVSNTHITVTLVYDTTVVRRPLMLHT